MSEAKDPEEYLKKMQRHAQETTDPETRNWMREFLRKLEREAEKRGKTDFPKASHLFLPGEDE
jgi:hypothetical protein